MGTYIMLLRMLAHRVGHHRRRIHTLDDLSRCLLGLRAYRVGLIGFIGFTAYRVYRV